MSTEKELESFKITLERMANWARNNPGTAGEPLSLSDGGPGDSDCISVFLASLFYKAGQKVRFVVATDPEHRMGANGVFVEVFHPTYGPNGQWIAVLPFAPWIFEGPQILTSQRVMEYEL